jgi:hypothetical protein
MAKRLAILAAAVLVAAGSARAQTAPGLGDDEAARTLKRLQAADERLVDGNALSPLSIREVTIFKDGNAFVMEQGSVKSDARGQVVLRGLPSPVLGTFWPFALDATLQSATASLQSEGRPRNVQSISEMLKANIGAQIIVIEASGKRYDATILGVTELPPLNTTQPIATDNYGRPIRNEIIQLQTEEGVRVAPITSITEVIFKKAPRLQTVDSSSNNMLRLQLDAPNKTTQAGAVYLQSGLRWIPNYRLQLSTGGRATMKLQATLVNDLADLSGVAAHLAIGVPSFAFKDTLDPIALSQEMARVALAFQGGGFGGASSNRFSNAIQTQIASGSYALAPQPASGPTVGEGSANEDFFFFDVKNLTLKKGERSIIPIAQNELKYQDIYVAQSPAAPPPQIYQSLNSEQQRQVLAATRAQFMHKLRVTNTSKQPLTTAPTLIERNGQLLAQTLMTYTATGGRSDINLAPAVDITLKRSEDETKRTPDALTYNTEKFSRIDVSGKLSVTSFRNEAVTIEITRQFIGKVETAGTGNTRGEIRQVGAGDDALLEPEDGAPAWTSYTNNYWRQVNPTSSVTWTLNLSAKSTLELPYTYFYFWR